MTPSRDTILPPDNTFDREKDSARGVTSVTILIACFNGKAHLEDCLRSVLASIDPGIALSIVVVDNASADGSAEFVDRAFPDVEVLRLPENRGFAGGNNAGWHYIQRRPTPTDYLAILNQDTIVQSGWLRALVDHLQNRPAVAVAQSKVLLWPQRDRINTVGNSSHFLGFGFMTGYGQINNGRFQQPRPIDFPSGAAMLIRAETLRPAGLFDDLFFLYLEDAELGWKLRQMGYRIEYVPQSVVWHKYAFRKDYQKHYYYLERNRWYLLATYYKTPTLLLLAPALLAMEVGQLFFAWRNGVLAEKFKAYQFFLCPAQLSRLLHRRREAQHRRKISDRAFTRSFIARVEFPELKSLLLDRIGNPMLNAYWQIVRKFIWW
jgi:hypothetical protein